MAMIRKPAHWGEEAFLGALFSMLCDSASYVWDADLMEWHDPEKRWKIRPSYSNLEWTTAVGTSKLNRKPSKYDGVWISTGRGLSFKDVTVLENRICWCIEALAEEDNPDQLSLLSNEAEEMDTEVPII